MNKLCFILPLLLLVSFSAYAADSPVGTVSSMHGALKVKRFSNGSVCSLCPGAVLYAKDQIWFTPTKDDYISINNTVMQNASITIHQDEAPTYWNPVNNHVSPSEAGGDKAIQVVIHEASGSGQQGN